MNERGRDDATTHASGWLNPSYRCPTAWLAGVLQMQLALVRANRLLPRAAPIFFHAQYRTIDVKTKLPPLLSLLLSLSSCRARSGLLFLFTSLSLSLMLFLFFEDHESHYAISNEKNVTSRSRGGHVRTRKRKRKGVVMDIRSRYTYLPPLLSLSLYPTVSTR